MSFWQNDARLQIGVISDKFEGQTPLIIHNIGSGVQEENILYNYKITGHFRLK
ncbi:DUF1287 domain-containing protein [Campylobacter concisus]|uniref:DUF1287 domain-containing protein n=1 Tax=Campylobacter concisus TaxID=199 RepID=UPI001E524D37|nr:DUF1287 domain-containing protein [Campylobacter concisus]